MPLTQVMAAAVRLAGKTWWMIILVVATGLAVDLALIHFFTGQHRIQQENAVTLELAALRARIEEQLNSDLYLVFGMAALIAVDADISEGRFMRLGRELKSKSLSLRHIAAAPDFKVRYVYPLKGNEPILGMNYRSVPDQWQAVLAVKESGHPILAGPLNLVQGGHGLIIRVPVMLADGGAFWGLVSAVIDFRGLLREVGLEPLPHTLRVAIRGKDGKGEKGEIFWGEKSLFEKNAQAVTMGIVLASGTGTWQIAAIPKSGWIVATPYRWTIHLSVLAIAMLVLLTTMARYRGKHRLIESEKRLKSMSQASHDAMIMIDDNSRVTFWNPAAEAMFGYTEAEALGKDLHQMLAIAEDAEKARIGMRHFAKTGMGPVVNNVKEMVAIRKTGVVFPVERAVAPFQLDGRWYAVGSVRDITARKEAEQKLTRLATTDSLTGLLNRRHYMERAEAQRQQAVRYRQPFSIIMFDLDHFKRINDTYGHDTGDNVLSTVAETTRGAMRGTDILGRLGGEEFAVAMPQTDLGKAVAAAERLRTGIMAATVGTPQGAVRFTTSIGVASLGASEETLATLMQQADKALYHAKRGGRNRVAVFSAAVPGSEHDPTQPEAEGRAHETS